MGTELESIMNKESLKQMKESEVKVRETKRNVEDEIEGRRTEEDQNYNSTHLSDPPGPKKAAPGASTPLALSSLRSHSVGFGASEFQRTNLNAEAPTFSSRDGGTDSAKQRENASDKHSMKENDSKAKNSDKDIASHSKIRDKKAIDVKEREVEHKQTQSGTHSHQSENTDYESVSKSQKGSPSQSQQHLNTKMTSNLPNSHECDGCKAGEHRGTGAEARAAVVKKGLPRTPRTDEAMWAAAALGFLLILLTLSVLHTRLYRHWRTVPSLYWHDPRQDYDSVAGRWTTWGLITFELFFNRWSSSRFIGLYS